MRYLWIAVTIAAAMLLNGCNKKTDSAPSTDADGADHESHEEHADAGGGVEDVEQQAELPPVPEAAREALAPTAGPDQVVMAFLEATRSGDEVLASQLLSKKALEATTSAGLIVKPPGTPSMQYEIGQVEYPTGAKDGAYVQSIWRERFEDGEDRFDVTWVLRKQSEGWRIVGMAIPGEDVPYLVNFEEPNDLRQKMDAGEQESAGDPASAEGQTEPVEGESEEQSTAERVTTPRNTLR